MCSQSLQRSDVRQKVDSYWQSFLMHRKQQVNVEGESSKPCSVDSGVPQGTVFSSIKSADTKV